MLVENEQDKLHIPPEKIEVLAEIESLNKFGTFATIDMLARTYNLSHEEVLHLPYSRVFAIQYMQAEKTRYEKRLRKIQEEQNKNKK